MLLSTTMTLKKRSVKIESFTFIDVILFKKALLLWFGSKSRLSTTTTTHSQHNALNLSIFCLLFLWKNFRTQRKKESFEWSSRNVRKFHAEIFQRLFKFVSMIRLKWNFRCKRISVENGERFSVDVHVSVSFLSSLDL